MLNRKYTGNTSAYIFTITALIFGIIAIQRIIQKVFFTAQPDIGAALSTAVQLPFLALTIYIAAQLHNTNTWNTVRSHRLTVWFSTGIIVFVSINLVAMLQIPPGTSDFFFAWICWAVSIGGGAGALIGYFEGKAITRAKAEERHAVRVEEAESREELLDYLNSLLRHEVLNSTTAIQGHSTLILDRHDLDDNIENSLHTIDNQATEMSSIIEDVRVLLNASKYGADLEPVDLCNTVETELQKLPERYGTVETHFTAPDSLNVMGDPLLKRIFSNLFTNAIEHNTSDIPTVTVDITNTDEEITVRIEDNGPGIETNETDTLFEKTTSDNPNHGLGLMLVKNLTVRYNATIELTKTNANGTTFTLTFPIPSGSTPTNSPSETTSHTPSEDTPTVDAQSDSTTVSPNNGLISTPPTTD